MIDRLLLLGATGDLAGRLLLPALARLLEGGRVPPGLTVVAAAPQDLDDDAVTAHVTARLAEHAPDLPGAARRALIDRLRYVRVDLQDAAAVAAAVEATAGPAGTSRDGQRPVAVYCALPPAAFGAALAALGGVGLPAGSRVAVEKPFGGDLDGAVRLNALLDDAVRGVPGAAFRTDHALGMPGAAALLARRGPAGDLAAVWHGGAVAQLDVLWEETLALEGRADFYDRAGALRDVLQNHLLQVLVLAAAELPDPAAQDDDAVHAARLALLRSLHAPAGAAPSGWTRRARYTAGHLRDGREVPDYAAEDGVDPARGTETSAEVVLASDAPRWAGTRFVLRTGKALAADRKGVLVHLRPDAPAVAGEDDRRRVWLDLDSRSAAGERVAGEVAAYEAVLADVLGGGTRLSVSAAEAEQAWRVVEPVLAAWAAGQVPLLEHPAGAAVRFPER